MCPTAESGGSGPGCLRVVVTRVVRASVPVDSGGGARRVAAVVLRVAAVAVVAMSPAAAAKGPGPGRMLDVGDTSSLDLCVAGTSD